MDYLVVVEKAGDNYSAYLPDVPGCVATGDNPEETLELLAGALKLHLQGLNEDGLPLPKPLARAQYISVS
jgi:predicted RNase H-like HicB family nuclease